MLVSKNRSIISALGLAAALHAAPLTERANSKRGIVGWLCHYNGHVPAVDISLDLPSMLGGLCAKVNYEYAGCESFRPDTKPATPQDAASGVHAESVGDDEDQQNDDQQLPAPKKKKNPPRPKASPAQAASVSHDEDDNDSHHKRPKPKKNKSPPHKSGADSEDSDSAHSFKSDGAEPAHHSHGSQPHKSSSEEDPNTAVKSLSNGESDDDDNGSCKADEYWSSEADRCVDQSYFSEPQADGLCGKGNLDAVIHLCLDVSTLGLTHPIHLDASVLKSGSGGNGARKCPLGKQYSSLLSVCIDDKFFSDPLIGHQCGNGWKLDLVLGICLDLAGCQNHSNNS